MTPRGVCFGEIKKHYNLKVKNGQSVLAAPSVFLYHKT